MGFPTVRINFKRAFTIRAGGVDLRVTSYILSVHAQNVNNIFI